MRNNNIIMCECFLFIQYSYNTVLHYAVKYYMHPPMLVHIWVRCNSIFRHNSILQLVVWVGANFWKKFRTVLNSLIYIDLSYKSINNFVILVFLDILVIIGHLMLYCYRSDETGPGIPRK